MDKWSEKIVPDGDIFSLDKLFVPINEHKTHWLVVVVFFDQKRIAVFDSMHSGKGENYLRIVFRYIQDEHRRKHETELTEKEKWKLVTSKATAPHQSNCESFKTKQKIMSLSPSLSHTHTTYFCVAAYDCGLFMILTCDFLSLDIPPIFTQSDVAHCRKRTALSILLHEYKL